MDVVNYALSKKLNWDNIKNKPFYDNSWVLDTSNVLETNDIDSSTGFVLVSNNPDDFYLLDSSDDIICYGKYDDDIEHKLTCIDSSLSGHIDYYYTDDDGNKTTMCYVVMQENTSIDIYRSGIRYKISNPSIGIWVMHDPTLNSIASIYTKDVHKIDPKFLPEVPQQSSIMIINIRQNDDGTYSADKTFSEILDVFKSGGSVYVYNSQYNVFMPLLIINNIRVVFRSFFAFDDGAIIIFVLDIDKNNNIIYQEDVYYTPPEPIDGDENKFLKGDGTWSELPLSFNDAGELEVTLNGVTKTFVPK